MAKGAAMRWILVMVIALWTAACGSGDAVVFAPTPLPPDVSPMLYRHPGGAFTVEVPRQWAVHVQNTNQLASATFTPPGESVPAVTMGVIHLDDERSLVEVINNYQNERRQYSEQERQAMGDGSWRLAGVRITVGGLPQQVNTFIEQQNNQIGVVEVVIPTDRTRLTELERITNTFRLNPDPDLQPTTLDTLQAMTTGILEVVSAVGWHTDQGVFFITGEVGNFGVTPVGPVPVRVSLEANDGTILAESFDITMGHGIPPGGYAPFSLRFGQGQPADASRFTLTLGSGPSVEDVMLDGRDLTWSNETTLLPEGHLLIEGTVTHIGDSSLNDVIATVTVFDTDRRVIAAGFTTLTDMAPGDSKTFQIRVPELGGDPMDSFVTVQARAND